MLNFVVARHIEDNWVHCLEPSLKRIGPNRVICVGDDPNKVQNIFTKYQAGILALQQNGLLDQDIVCFVHEDVVLIDPFFYQKIETIFNEKKDIGVLGITGTTELNETGGWWNSNNTKLRGHLIQGKDNYNVEEGYHLIKGEIGYHNDLVVVDGLFMCVSGKVLREGLGFDLQTYPDGNDMYDIDFCITAKQMGYAVVCADILLFHKSQGMGALTDSWKINHDRFVNKWKNKGFKFPIVTNDFKAKELVNNIVEIDI